MTLYFLLPRRTDAWAERTLGWLSDVGDLGAHWSPVAAPGGAPPADAPLLTFMNNIGTAEGPDALAQYEFDRAAFAMRVERDRASGRLLVCDTVHGGRRVELCCAHFSGGQKYKLNSAWLAEHFGLHIGDLCDLAR